MLDKNLINSFRHTSNYDLFEENKLGFYKRIHYYQSTEVHEESKCDEYMDIWINVMWVM